jgi:hypothetical protein
LIVFLLVSACSGPSQELNRLEGRVGQIEHELAQIRAQGSVASGSLNAAVGEQEILREGSGALSRRLAEIEYAQAGGAARGLISLARALEACLAAIEQPADCSYVVEDIEFIADWKAVQADSSATVGWRFTLQGAKGLFVVAVDAQSGHVFWVNHLNVGD